MSSSVTKTTGGIILIVVLMLIVGVVVALFNRASSPTGQTPQTNTNQVPTGAGAPVAAPVFPPMPPENAAVYSYTGNITAIDDATQIITMQTSFGTRQVQITQDTEILGKSRKMRENLLNLPPEEAAKAINKTTPYTKELVVGDIISAESTTNIKDKSPFDASDR